MYHSTPPVNTIAPNRPQNRPGWLLFIAEIKINGERSKSRPHIHIVIMRPQLRSFHNPTPIATESNPKRSTSTSTTAVRVAIPPPSDDPREAENGLGKVMMSNPTRTRTPERKLRTARIVTPTGRLDLEFTLPPFYREWRRHRLVMSANQADRLRRWCCASAPCTAELRSAPAGNPKPKIQNCYRSHSRPMYTASAVQNFSGREIRTRSPNTL